MPQIGTDPAFPSLMFAASGSSYAVAIIGDRCREVSKSKRTLSLGPQSAGMIHLLLSYVTEDSRELSHMDLAPLIGKKQLGNLPRKPPKRKICGCE